MLLCYDSKNVFIMVQTSSKVENNRGYENWKGVAGKQRGRWRWAVSNGIWMITRHYDIVPHPWLFTLIDEYHSMTLNRSSKQDTAYTKSSRRQLSFIYNISLAQDDTLEIKTTQRNGEMINNDRRNTDNNQTINEWNKYSISKGQLVREELPYYFAGTAFLVAVTVFVTFVVCTTFALFGAVFAVLTTFFNDFLGFNESFDATYVSWQTRKEQNNGRYQNREIIC